MKRRPNWRETLAAAIEARRRTADTNCALFAADCVLAMTGVDLAAPYRGRFSTIAEGLALLAADGYGDLCAFARAHLEEVHPAHARAGDLAAFDLVMFVPGGTGYALGVVNGERVTVWRGAGLLGTMPLDAAARAFRVP